MNSSLHRRRGWTHSVLSFLLLLEAGLNALSAADIKIEFIPPPMDGTISLGIYNSAGKLVRVLRKEATTDEFTVALNGLIAKWDGANDNGAPCTPGKYHARGWMVGDLDIDGVDFIGNDWVTEDDSPRINRITAIACGPSGNLLLKATTPGQQQAGTFSVSIKAAVKEEDGPEVKLVSEPKVTFPIAPHDGHELPLKGVSLSGTAPALDSAPGPDGSVWVTSGTDIRKYSASGALQATIPVEPDEPKPVKLAAGAGDRLYLFSENSETQRVTAFNCTGITASSAAKELFSEDIRFSDRYEQVGSLLTYPGGDPFTPAAELSVSLVANPLSQDKPGAASIKAVADMTGTILVASDGLPLVHVSETPHLRWAVLGRQPGVKAVTVFESDGSVVAEYKVARIANMMAFDAGEIELPAAGAKP